jgi:hypothetical protein
MTLVVWNHRNHAERGVRNEGLNRLWNMETSHIKYHISEVPVWGRN